VPVALQVMDTFEETAVTHGGRIGVKKILKMFGGKKGDNRGIAMLLVRSKK
jgi:hypothetical protein